jgi:hypothetical protein
MLSQQNLKEIFRAFIGTGARPSPDLIGALAEASGKTAADLQEEYKAYTTWMTDDDTAPYKE